MIVRANGPPRDGLGVRTLSMVRDCAVAGRLPQRIGTIRLGAPRSMILRARLRWRSPARPLDPWSFSSLDVRNRPPAGPVSGSQNRATWAGTVPDRQRDSSTGRGASRAETCHAPAGGSGSPVVADRLLPGRDPHASVAGWSRRASACLYGEAIDDEGLMMGRERRVGISPERQPDVRTARTCSPSIELRHNLRERQRC